MFMTSDTYRRLSIAGQCVLIALGILWALFERGAPVINVEWRDGLGTEERQQAEEQLFLESGEWTEGSWRYSLGWPVASNIAAVVRHPDVSDTHHLNRATNQLDDDVAFSRSRVWWVGPFKGTRGRTQFRYAAGMTTAFTLICAWLARRPAGTGRRGALPD